MLAVWLISSMIGDSNFVVALLISIFILLVYEFIRLKNFGWLVTAIQNVVTRK